MTQGERLFTWSKVVMPTACELTGWPTGSNLLCFHLSLLLSYFSKIYNFIQCSACWENERGKERERKRERERNKGSQIRPLTKAITKLTIVISGARPYLSYLLMISCIPAGQRKEKPNTKLFFFLSLSLPHFLMCICACVGKNRHSFVTITWLNRKAGFGQ